MERPTSRSMMGHHHHRQHQQRNYHSDIATPPLHLRSTTMINDGSMTAFNEEAKPVVTKMSEHRRNNKPIMEKRRRARINSCLGELKGLILQAMKKDPARHSKLEKADILEMTVKHLQNLQRQQMAVAVSTDPTVITKFRAGFNECATEVASYVGRIDGVDTGVRQRLVGHLRSCITGLNHLPGPTSSSAATFGPPLTTTNATFQSASDALNILSRTPLTTVRDDANSNGTALRMFAGLHLVPSRLPNGDIAFLLPQQQHQHQDHDRSSATPPSSSRSDLSDDDDDDDQDYERERSDSTPVLKAGTLPSTKTVPRLLPAPFPLATATNRSAASTAQRDRRTPSAFTSVLTGSAVQSVVTSSTTPPIATGNGSGAGGRTCTVTSSTGNTFSPLEDSSAGPSQAEKSTAKSATAVEVENEATPSTSNVCSTTDNDKMWRPW